VFTCTLQYSCTLHVIPFWQKLVCSLSCALFSCSEEAMVPSARLFLRLAFTLLVATQSHAVCQNDTETCVLWCNGEHRSCNSGSCGCDTGYSCFCDGDCFDLESCPSPPPALPSPVTPPASPAEEALGAPSDDDDDDDSPWWAIPVSIVLLIVFAAAVRNCVCNSNCAICPDVCDACGCCNAALRALGVDPAS
jgi:hypothetical protein